MLERDLNITPSILDRLLDFDIGNPNEPAGARYQSLREMKNSIRRDIEALLNTRVPIYSIDEDLEEIHQSVACFGLPDFTAMGAVYADEVKTMTSSIKKAIERFEPRLVGVKVSLEPVDATAKQVRFRIEANLDIEPAPEPVVFDTVLQPGNSEFKVNEK